MQLARRTVHGFEVLRVEQNLNINSETADLLAAVTRLIADGRTRVAIEFTADSMLYSRTIAVLVQCAEHLRDAGGKLVVLKPSEHVITSLRITGLECIVNLCFDDEDLAKL